MAYFEVFRDGQKLHRVDIIGAEVIIGRDTAAGVRVDDPLVSRRHARVFIENGAMNIEDLGTTNGLYVNGVREYHRPLKDGDRLELGAHQLVYRQPVGEELPDEESFTTASDLPALTEGDAGELGSKTQHISPAEMAKLRRQAQSQLEPHLVQERVKPPRILALKHAKNVMGTGDKCELRVPEVGGGQVASFERNSDGGFLLKKLGLLGSIKVNGEKVREAVLRDGDKIEAGNGVFTYREGDSG